MLLQTLPLFGNLWCKDNFNLIPRFMKSVFNHRPSKPRYLMTWDVSVVLRYLEGLMPLSKLTLKLLTFKTLALIALATAPRAQTLCGLNLNNMIVEQQAVVFTFSDILKTSKAGQSYSLKIEHFKNESICAMHTLLFYIKKTSSVRLSEKVFVSFVTYRKVTTCTLARWLRTVLELSGIDTTVYKAHSFRGASASAAYGKGCSMNTIISHANWKSDKNFRKFYCRHADSNVSYSNAVFES